jgi:hypothetical protein
MCRVVADQSLNLSLGLSSLPPFVPFRGSTESFLLDGLSTINAEAVSNWFGSGTAITDPFLALLRAMKHLFQSFQSPLTLLLSLAKWPRFLFDLF